MKKEEVESALGQAEVREVFKVSKVGTIAGCMVTEGEIKMDASLRVLRDQQIIYESTVESLKRFKDDAKEVKAGFECGIKVAKFDDIHVGDVLECYEMVEKK
jgi:translation initiation factor IF-2